MQHIKKCTHSRQRRYGIRDTRATHCPELIYNWPLIIWFSLNCKVGIAESGTVQVRQQRISCKCSTSFAIRGSVNNVKLICYLNSNCRTFNRLIFCANGIARVKRPLSLFCQVNVIFNMWNALHLWNFYWFSLWKSQNCAVKFIKRYR